MCNSKTLCHPIIRNAVLLLVIILMHSCHKCQVRNVIEDTSTLPQAPQDPDPQKVKKTVIVLLHDLASPGDLEPVKNKLTVDLQDQKNVEVIAPTRPNSSTDAIDTQAADLYAMLQKDNKDNDLIIYGHGQGAVLAASLWCRHSKDLNIKGMILDRGPLAGLELLSAAKRDKTFDLFSELRITNIFQDFMANKPKFKEIVNHFYINCNGLTDLAPDSPIIQEIVATLPTVDIPLSLICCESDFLLDIYQHYRFTPFLPAYLQNHQMGSSINTWFGQSNDGLVTCFSQSLNNLGANNPLIEVENFGKHEFYHYCLFVHGLIITEPLMVKAYNKLLGKVKACIPTN